MAMPNTSADSDEKFSTRKQWHERSEKPIAQKYMTTAQIEQYRLVLVQSYKCLDSDIDYIFEKILDENDADRDDCIWLKYRLNCIVADKPQLRVVFVIKLPIPDRVKKTAENLQREARAKQSARRKTMWQIEDAPAPPQVEEIEEIEEVKPKLRRVIKPKLKPN